MFFTLVCKRKQQFRENEEADIHMKIAFNGDRTDLQEGIESLMEELNIEITPDGFPIFITNRPGNLHVQASPEQANISYSEKSHFFRALGLFLENKRQKTSFEIEEVPQFRSCGVMLDASRNGVLKVDRVKFLLRKMAIMGLNQLMVYTEDTYEVEELPYFGYMRGRYTKKEIREMDEYAYSLGIEMIPCIQTLAHLREALKWEYADDIRDTEDILLVGEERTYDFLKKIITAAAQPYRSNRIHVGMDEAHELGLGRYLDQNDYVHRFSLMMQHLQRVLEITSELQLEPMMWSDMFFTVGSEKNIVYDPLATFPVEMLEQMPNVQLVYWNYYSHEKELYNSMFQRHAELRKDTIFAGGIWTWNGMAPNYGKTWMAATAGLQAAKESGVQEVFATMWGDNGQETSLLTVLPGLQLYAEHAFHKTVTKERVEQRFSFCAGSHLDDFMLFSALDETPGVSKHNLAASMTAKVLLWQDPLIGLYDKNIEGLLLSEHYQATAEKLKKAKQRNAAFYTLFDFYEQLASVLAKKAELGVQLKNIYDHNQKEQMKEKRLTVRSLKTEVNHLRKAHRKLWLENNKAFGWEVLDIRYGGLLSRLETADYRLIEWEEGAIDHIEELDAQRLAYRGPYGNPEETIGNALYHRIVTASAFSS